MENKPIESRAYTCGIQIRDNAEKKVKVIEGIPIVFEKKANMGWFDEVINRHALDNADMKDVRFLVNHNINELPLARSRNNNANSTMQLSVNEDGLHTRIDLDTEGNARAKELASAVEREDVTGMSFMFTVNKEKWSDVDSEHPTREILSIGRIFEVSAVTYPAYEDTSINARSLDSVRASLDSAKAALESARKIEETREQLKNRLENL